MGLLGWVSDAAFHFAARIADVPENGALRVELAGEDILVCRSGGEMFAVENVCSHTGQPLERGVVRDGWIMCPFHGARFALDSGEVLRPPATCPIRTFPLRVSDGMIEVAVGAEGE